VRDCSRWHSARESKGTTSPKITYFHVARQVGWLVAGLLIISLDAARVHAAVLFPADHPS
jgi:hypothetical protein